MLVPIKIIRSSDFRQFHSQTASEDGTEGTCLNTELVPYSDIHCTYLPKLGGGGRRVRQSYNAEIAACKSIIT